MHNMLREEGSKAFDFLNVIIDSFKQLKLRLFSSCRYQENQCINDKVQEFLASATSISNRKNNSLPNPSGITMVEYQEIYM